MGFFFSIGDYQTFMKHVYSMLVSSTARVKWRNGMKAERRGGMSGDERSQQRVEQTDRYGNKVKRETEI